MIFEDLGHPIAEEFSLRMRQNDKEFAKAITALDAQIEILWSQQDIKKITKDMLNKRIGYIQHYFTITQKDYYELRNYLESIIEQQKKVLDLLNNIKNEDSAAGSIVRQFLEGQDNNIDCFGYLGGEQQCK